MKTKLPGPRLLLLLSLVATFPNNNTSSEPSTHKRASPNILLLKQCTHLKSDIVPELTNEVVQLLQPWRNQCPFHTAYTGFWFRDIPDGVSNGQHTPADAKCCSTPLDNSLSEALVDLHNNDHGPLDVTTTWNVECPPHSFITALRVAENTENRYKKHVSAMKCALLINHIVDYGKCQRIDFQAVSGGIRDPSKQWRAECPQSMRLVGLYDDQEFTGIKYAKCCPYQGFNIINNIPWKCTFAGGNTCEWKNRSDMILKWKPQTENKGAFSYLTLGPQQISGKAQLLSPGMPRFEKRVCLRLQYYLFGSALLNVMKKAFIPELHFTNLTLLGVIERPLNQVAQRDFVVQSDTSFQIVIEGVRQDGFGVLHLIQIAFVNVSSCAADMCSPPSRGCKDTEVCRVANGFLRCICREGYFERNGDCDLIAPTAEPKRTTIRPTTSKNEGNRGGGTGKKDGGGGEKTPIGTKVGQSMHNGKTQWGSWVYTAIGATAGIFLVLIFVFGFMMYRRRVHYKQQRHSFVMEMRRRSFHPFGSLTDSNVVDGVIPGRSVNVYVENPQRSRIDSVWSSSAGQFEQPADTASSVSGSPNSHHYHEVEPEDDAFEARRFSQFTLIQPVYGSTEELVETNGNMFSDPPFDEDELLNKLGREISYHAITLKEEIGHGAFGFVKLGYWDKHNNERIKVAVKMLKEPTSNEERVKFLQEAAIMRQFDHTNVIRMYGIVTRFCSPMIVLEYMSNKNLRKYIYKLRKTRERANLGGVDYDLHRLFLRMAREITAGMCYLHSLQFVHRDLAARNILLDSNLVCKIGDFGLARDLIGCEYYESGGGAIPVRWTAPEAIQFKRYSSASDTWSFGITLHEIWSLGIKPYSEWDNNTVMDKVAQGYRLPPPQNCPRVIYHLMIDCWHPEPSKRPRFSQIKFCLSHHDDRLIGRIPRHDRIRSVTCNDIVDNQEQGLYDDLQYIYCKTE